MGPHSRPSEAVDVSGQIADFLLAVCPHQDGQEFTEARMKVEGPGLLLYYIKVKLIKSLVIFLHFHDMPRNSEHV